MQRQGRIVNKRELAEFFGLSPQAIDGWLSRGCPYLKKGGPRVGYQFDTAAVADWRADQRVAEAISERKPEDENDAQHRKLCAEATTAELKAYRELGQLVSVEDVERTWTEVIAVCRTKFLAIPSKICTLVIACDTAHEARELIEQEIHEVLNELGDESTGESSDSAEEFAEGAFEGDDGDQAAPEVALERVGRGKSPRAFR